MHNKQYSTGYRKKEAIEKREEWKKKQKEEKKPRIKLSKMAHLVL